jgi:hypothetical protein
MRAEVEKITRILEEEASPFTAEEVRRVVQEQGLEVEGDLAEITQEVLEEGLRRTLGVLEKTWEALGIPPLPEAEDCLRKGGGVHFWHYNPKTREEKAQMEVLLYDETGSVIGKNSYSLSMDLPPREFGLYLKRGRTVVYSLPPGGASFKDQARRGRRSFGVRANRPYFRGRTPEDYWDFVHVTKVLRPVLSVMGFSDIEEALDSLLLMKEGDVQTKKGYILAKKKDFWLLNRTPILGDADLDRALVRGEPVTLSFPEDVEIAFSVLLDKGWVETNEIYIPHIRIRWGDETAIAEGGREFCVTALDRFSLSEAIRGLLKKEIERFEQGAHSHLADRSPEMLTFLKAFARHEDPFRVLAEGGFAPHVKAEFFLDL